MSAALYSIRFYWDGDRGCAKMEGFFRNFFAKPFVPGLARDVELVDYAPETDTARIRLARDGDDREMHPSEIAAVRSYLEGMQQSPVVMLGPRSPLLLVPDEEEPLAH